MFVNNKRTNEQTVFENCLFFATESSFICFNSCLNISIQQKQLSGLRKLNKHIYVKKSKFRVVCSLWPRRQKVFKNLKKLGTPKLLKAKPSLEFRISLKIHFWICRKKRYGKWQMQKARSNIKIPI